MKIYEVTSNKSDYMDILLIGDEDESMVSKYIEQSEIFILYDNDMLISICAVEKINSETVEITNIATYPEYQNKGYASKLLDFICNKYKTKYKKLILGTGENEKTLNFYKKRGFTETHIIKNFFTDNYSHPIIENGKLLTDMIYLKKDL